MNPFRSLFRKNSPENGNPVLDQAQLMPSCMARLQNMKSCGFSPSVIFDCGASVGQWSLEVAKLFPHCQLVVIEPNPLVIPETKELLRDMTVKPVIVECAVGSEDGEAFLNIWDNPETSMEGSSLKSHVQGDPRQKVGVELRTLDSISRQYSVSPDLVKLDLQGYELEALNGAKNLLKDTEAFIIEFGCLQAYRDRTTPLDLFTVMYDNGYCLYDVVDLIYRPFDNALTGGDFFFVKNHSALKAHKGYN